MSDAVILPDAPPLGGLAFRSFRDAQDYLGMAAVHAGAQRWDQVDPLSAREHVPTATDLAATFPEDNARGNPDLLLAAVDGQLVGYVLSDMALTPLTPPPPMALAPGITLRPLELLHYREVYRAWKDAFAELWTSTPESEEDFGAFVDDNLSGSSFDPTLCHIAWAADQVVGLVFTRLRQRVGTIPEVAVRPTWR